MQLISCRGDVGKGKSASDDRIVLDLRAIVSNDPSDQDMGAR